MCEGGLLRVINLHAVGEVGQLWRSRFHGQRVFFDVETGERCRIANEDVGVFASKASCSCDGLCFDTFTKLQVVSTRARLRRVTIDVDRHGLGSLGPTWLGVGTWGLCHGD